MQTFTDKNQLFAPYAWYHQMRTTEPVYYDEEHKLWHLFRYADILRAMNDYGTFSSDPRATMDWEPEGPDPILSSILRIDPPRHRQLRGLAALAFTPRVVAQMAPRIEAITHELLDKVVESASGEFDVIRDLAYPLPVTVIAELLGIPPERREDFKRWSNALVSISNETETSVLDELQEMYGYFTQVLEERRRQPQSDLISNLLAAEIDGQRLSDIELLGFCVLLLVAGNETTTNLIGNAILALDQHPAAVERLRATPALVPNAVEEVLRYASPVKAMERFTRNAVTIGDKHIDAQEIVVAWFASANRDEEQFPDADRFDIERDPNRHLAFGHGIHFCLGAPLARLEARIALSSLLERLPGQWHIPDDASLEPAQSGIVFGVRNLPMTWDRH